MMDSYISRIVTACFFKSALEVREYLEDHCSVSSAPCLSCACDDEMIRKIIDYVDDNYLNYHGITELAGLPSPIIKQFQTDSIDRMYYDPCSRLYSKDIYYPCHEKKTADPEYLLEFLKEISDVDQDKYCLDDYFQIIWGVFEDYVSMISANGGNSSLFELTKLRAGLATALYFYSGGKGFSFDVALKDFVISCSFDFLGIKDFKFRSENSTNLRKETAASLYVDLLRENVLDEFMSELGISRCNLVFSGGRHIHMFLPNTESVLKKIDVFIRSLNDWLVKKTGDTVFVSYGSCALDSLKHDEVRGDDYYLNIFTKIANHKALMESHRYSVDQIEYMNSCKYGNLLDLDVMSNSFTNEKYYVVTDIKKENSIEILEGRHLYASDTADYLDALRVYRSNHLVSRKIVPAVEIWHQKLYEGGADLCKAGFYLIRLDIDGFNLHMLGNQTCNISPNEKMELSKHFSFFLKRDVTLLSDILSNKDNCICMIHEGADDLFILVSENILIKFVKELVLHYEKFTGGSLSFSAGISEFDPKYGFSYNCAMAQHLMDCAKKNPGKNSVVIKSESVLMKWKDFIANVENIETVF